VSASWVEITRHRAIDEQVRAAVLSAESRRLTVVFPKAGMASTYSDVEFGEALVLDRFQQRVADAYSSARFWSDQHRAALINEAILPVGEAPKPVRVVAA
jgi:hypothetical protein